MSRPFAKHRNIEAENHPAKAAFLQRIDQRIAEAGEMKVNGELYRPGGADNSGGRNLYGAGGVQAGKMAGGGGEVDVNGPGIDPAKPPRVPKTIGWEVSWEDPRSAKSVGGQVFLKSAEDSACAVCQGKCRVEQTPIDPKGKVCRACHGVGQRSKRVEDYIRSLSARGLRPIVRPAKGKLSNQRFPLAGHAFGTKPDEAI